MPNKEQWERAGDSWQIAGSVSDVVAGRLKEVRQHRRLTVQELAKKCAEHPGPKLSATMIYDIESGRPDKEGNRRRHVTVDELMLLSVALEVAPVHLLVPTVPDTEGPDDTSGMAALHYVWREFIRGNKPFPHMDERAYFSEAPPEEFSALIFRDFKKPEAE